MWLGLRRELEGYPAVKGCSAAKGYPPVMETWRLGVTWHLGAKPVAELTNFGVPKGKP